MNKRIGAWALLYALLASLSGTMLSCKSSAKPTDSSVQVAEGMKISMDCTITLPDKKTAPCSPSKEPVVYVQGQHRLLPALEVALAGMKVGEKKTVTLTPEQAFGSYEQSKKLTVKREQLPPDVKVGSGIKTKEGQEGRVLEISDASAVLDFNHPLAGKDLVFDVTILKVEKP